MYEKEYRVLKIKKIDKKKVTSICEKRKHVFKRGENAFLNYYDKCVDITLVFKKFFAYRSGGFYDSGFVRIYFINGRKYDGCFSDELSIKFIQILKMSNEIYTLEIE